MGKNYDNWERLVRAVLLREQFRELSLLSSPSSSSSRSSSFSFHSTSQILDQSLIERQGSELPADHSDIMIDGDGKIKEEELEALLCQLGAELLNHEELPLILSEMDRDGDGCITFEDFHAIGSTIATPTCHMELRDVFDFFDLDHDGKITAEELFNGFKMIGDAQCIENCRRMIRGVDRNGDGFVCFEDFSFMMEHQWQR